ncbi:MAG: hypothetical protein WEB87_03045 [Bacteriovoracaceae bacterium]
MKSLLLICAFYYGILGSCQAKDQLPKDLLLCEDVLNKASCADSAELQAFGRDMDSLDDIVQQMLYQELLPQAAEKILLNWNNWLNALQAFSEDAGEARTIEELCPKCDRLKALDIDSADAPTLKALNEEQVLKVFDIWAENFNRHLEKISQLKGEDKKKAAYMKVMSAYLQSPFGAFFAFDGKGVLLHEDGRINGIAFYHRRKCPEDKVERHICSDQIKKHLNELKELTQKSLKSLDDTPRDWKGLYHKLMGYFALATAPAGAPSVNGHLLLNRDQSNPLAKLSARKTQKLRNLFKQYPLLFLKIWKQQPRYREVLCHLQNDLKFRAFKDNVADVEFEKLRYAMYAAYIAETGLTLFAGKLIEAPVLAGFMLIYAPYGSARIIKELDEYNEQKLYLLGSFDNCSPGKDSYERCLDFHEAKDKLRRELIELYAHSAFRLGDVMHVMKIISLTRKSEGFLKAMEQINKVSGWSKNPAELSKKIQQLK